MTTDFTLTQTRIHDRGASKLLPNQTQSAYRHTCQHSCISRCSQYLQAHPRFVRYHEYEAVSQTANVRSSGQKPSTYCAFSTQIITEPSPGRQGSPPPAATGTPEKPPAAGTPRPAPTEIRPDAAGRTRAATSPRARRGRPGSGAGERHRKRGWETTRSGLGAGTPPARPGAAAQPLQHPAPIHGARPVSPWRVQLTIVLPAPEETAPCEAGRGGGGFRRCGNERTLTGARGAGCDV